MKKNAYLVLFTIFMLSSCFWVENKDTNKVNTSSWITNISSWSLTETGIIIPEVKELSINEKISKLITKEEAIKNLKEIKSWDYLEELPRINSYFTESPFYEFYILQSIYLSDKNQCNNIVLEDKKSMCNELYDNFKDKEKVVDIYKKYNEEELFAKNMYNTFTNLSTKNIKCDNDNIIQYLSCKKILDKNFDVENTYINYSRLEYSNFSNVKEYKNDIIKEWNMDSTISELIEKLNINTWPEL